MMMAYDNEGYVGITIDELPNFINGLVESVRGKIDDGDIKAAYSDIVTAMGKAAAAAARTINNSSSGGISGYQAGAVCWQFIQEFNPGMLGKCGTRLMNLDNMLYPQYERDFTTIDKLSWDALQEEARKRLDGDKATVHPNVRLHWENIVKGVVPFGFRVDNQ